MGDSNMNPINEEWIKKKLNIEIDNLEDIKSLSLPGTYQEKIVRFGDAFYRFTRLKDLDLSRNAIVSLDGLESLRCLEKLNLYYNNINSLKELDKLKYNKNLVELDLRLNPITKEEIDYRLYLIHLVPSLKVFDDREIRDAERQMAHSYYDNMFKNNEKKASYELFQSSNNSNTNNINNNNSNPVLSRVRSVSNIVKRSAGINDSSDDEGHLLDVQNMITYHSTDNETRTKSNNMKPGYEAYSTKDLKEIGEKESRTYSNYETNRRNSTSSNFAKHKSSSLQDLANGMPDKHLQFADEYEAYSSYKSRATFTPNPSYEPNNDENNEKAAKNYRKTSNSTETEIQFNLDDKGNPLFGILDLVDRYWNGTKSLHKNFKFLGLANQLLNSYSKYVNDTNPLETQVNLLQSQIKALEEENRKLNQTLAQQKNTFQHDRQDNETLNKNYLVEIDNLKKKLIIAQEECRKLRKELNDKSDKMNKHYTIDNMEAENDNLKQDCEIMKLKLRQYEQMQQLTAMLQESHKSLVTTNEHLLREIHDQKHPRPDSAVNPSSIRVKYGDLDTFLAQAPQQQQQQQTVNNNQNHPTRKQFETLTNTNNNRYIYSSTK